MADLRLTPAQRAHADRNAAAGIVQHHGDREVRCGKPHGRTWSLPAEPGPEVTAVRDRHGRIWTREPDGWIYRDRPAFVYRLPWHGLFMQGHGPLTDATQEEP